MKTSPVAAAVHGFRRGHWARHDRGASTSEYGLMIAGIAAIIVLAVYGFGGGVTSLFDNTCTSLSQQVNAGNC